MLFVWALLAASAGLTAETLARRGFGWWDWWWVYVPLALTINYAIYRLLTGGAGWLPSILLFSTCTGVGRIALALFVLNEPLSRPNLAAAAAMLIAVGINLFWRS